MKYLTRLFLFARTLIDRTLCTGERPPAPNDSDL